MGTDYDFDLLDPVHLAEPYGLFRRLRNTASLVHVPDPDVWVATSYAAVHSVLRDTRRFSSFEGLGAGWSLRAERHGRELEMSFQAGLPGVNVMLGADGADHARLRAIAAPYFTRKAVEACKPFVESKIGGLVDNVIEHGGDCEAVADLIAPVPAATLAHLVGLPPSLCNEMESFASALSGSWDPTSPLALKSQRMRLGRLGWDMIRALRNLLSSPSHVQEGSFVRELADRSNDHHDEMTDYEAISFLVLAIMAGVETTRSCMANVLQSMVQQPAIYERVRSDLEVADSIVDESLRLDSPVQTTWRGTLETAVVGETTVPSGALVMLCLGAANRDPDVYLDPDSFIIGRDSPRSIAFGAGPHHCIGAGLARMEATCMLRLLAQRVPMLTPMGDGVRTRNFIIRGMESLPMSLSDART